MSLKPILRCFFCILISQNLSNNLTAQNLLNTNSWIMGTGSAVGFNHVGSVQENVREYGYNHIGENVVIWKALPDGTGGDVGGWESNNIIIDNNKSYRFTVWLKKSFSSDGVSNFECYTFTTNNGYNLFDLNGSIATGKFWSGDLPVLDRWYLLVGYVHEQNYVGTNNLGRIYDGVTGNEVIEITDFKFKSTATYVQHHTNLNNDYNVQDIQFFYEPRIEEINGTEIPIDELLSLNTNSSLIFAFDNAGNQKQRYYCDSQACVIPEPPQGRPSNQAVVNKEISLNEENNKSSLQISPNPTKDFLKVSIVNESKVSIVDEIKIYNVNGMLVKKVAVSSLNDITIDLSDISNGVYIIHTHLSDGTSINKQIIKN